MIPNSATTARRLTPLLAGHPDLYALPADVLAAVDGITRLTGEAQAARAAADAADPAAAERLLVAATAAAARDDLPDLPDPAPITAAGLARATAGARERMASAAVKVLDDELLDLVTAAADNLLVDMLRPAFEAALEDARAAATALPPSPDAESLLRGPEKGRKAWVEVDGIVSRIAMLREAAAALHRFGPPLQWDEAGEFGELKNLAELAPDYRRREYPWPTEPRSRLLWLLHNGGELWMPSRGEQDAAWYAAHGEAVEARQRSQHAVAGYRAAFGG